MTAKNMINESDNVHRDLWSDYLQVSQRSHVVLLKLTDKLLQAQSKTRRLKHCWALVGL